MCTGIFKPPKPPEPPPPPPTPEPPPEELKSPVTPAEKRKRAATGGRYRRGSGGMQIAGTNMGKGTSGLKINQG